MSPCHVSLWSHPLCPPPAETSPEQRGSEVHTKKTVMIKTIETRDGEVSAGRLREGGWEAGDRARRVFLPSGLCCGSVRRLTVPLSHRW